MRLTKAQALTRRHRRVRQKISGTAARPRICLNPSSRHISAQVIDDLAGNTLAAVTTKCKENAGKNNRNTTQAKLQGIKLGEKLKELGITTVVFDRGGFRYHGVVKAFADGVRSVDEKDHFNF